MSQSRLIEGYIRLLFISRYLKWATALINQLVYVDVIIFFYILSRLVDLISVISD